MFGIGETELVIIVVFAFLLFGPDKLPGMGRTLGRVLRQFREASDGFTEVVQTNIMDPASEELQKSPKQRQREAQEAMGEDADVAAPAGQEEVPVRRETFAERKARLQAERAAQAAAQEKDEPADEPAGPSANVDSDDDLPQGDASPARTTAADLYAMSGRKSSRSAADESSQEEQPAQTSNDGGEDGNGEA